MVDYFALGITHLLMALAAWRLLLRDDLDREDKACGEGSAVGPDAGAGAAAGDRRPRFGAVFRKERHDA